MENAAESTNFYAIVSSHSIPDEAVLAAIRRLGSPDIQGSGGHYTVNSGGQLVHLKHDDLFAADRPPELTQSWQETMGSDLIEDIWLIYYSNAARRIGARIASTLATRLIDEKSGGFIYNVRTRKMRWHKKRSWWRETWDKLGTH